jgi:ABC-type lipoprotein release transport system permease subunit
MSQNTRNDIASKAYRIVGVFRAKLSSTEKRYVFVSRTAAQKMLGMGEGVSEISIVVNKDENVELVAEKINDAVNENNYEIYTWKELLPMLDAYVEIFNGFIVIWYLVVFVAMSFGIINTLLMAVFERMREFGLLKALGMKPFRIVRSVLFESVFILAMGMAVGNLLAWLMVSGIAHVGIDLSALAAGFEYAGMSSIIYPKIVSNDVMLANVVVTVLGIAVSLYPAFKAARITPVEAMARN